MIRAYESYCTIPGIYLSILLAAFKLTARLVLLSPLHSWKGVEGNCSTLGNREAMDGSGGVEEEGASGLSPGCHQKGKECDLEEELWASQRVRDMCNSLRF